eukprot:SAG11_NODE_13809_length_638_cov_1.237477_2_plen_66_part_01
MQKGGCRLSDGESCAEAVEGRWPRSRAICSTEADGWSCMQGKTKKTALHYAIELGEPYFVELFVEL